MKNMLINTFQNKQEEILLVEQIAKFDFESLLKLLKEKYEKKELTESLTTDYIAYAVFNYPHHFNEYLKRYLISSTGRPNKVKSIIFWDLNLCIVMNNSYEIVNLLDTSYPLFARFVAENVKFTDKDGPYVNIEFYNPIVELPKRKNSSKLLMFAAGNMPDDKKDAHHIFHAILTMSKMVEYITKKEHGQKRAQFKDKSDAIFYFKTEILKTDDIGFDIFMKNCITLFKSEVSKRGIYVHNFNPTELLLGEQNIKGIDIETSKY